MGKISRTAKAHYNVAAGEKNVEKLNYKPALNSGVSEQAQSSSGYGRVDGLDGYPSSVIHTRLLACYAAEARAAHDALHPAKYLFLLSGLRPTTDDDNFIFFLPKSNQTLMIRETTTTYPHAKLPPTPIPFAEKAFLSRL